MRFESLIYINDSWEKLANGKIHYDDLKDNQSKNFDLSLFTVSIKKKSTFLKDPQRSDMYKEI
jgi:hypothetical protein